MVQHLHALPSSRARETGDSSAPPIPGEGITSQLCNPCDVMVFNPFPDPGNPHGRPLARRDRPEGVAGGGASDVRWCPGFASFARASSELVLERPCTSL